MKWIVYTALASSLVGGAVWAASQTEQEEAQEVEEFVPTEKVPADSSISFPVDI